MKIVRKSGAIEEFSAEQLIASLADASDEANEPLPMSDINRIVAGFLEIAEGKERMASYQVKIIVTGLLYTKGYYGVIDKYLTYTRKRM
ncbi:MAG: hypothetical protein LBJ10_01680 [Clostridiales bacterium]|jgi:hypothetical protein|nr:hypothetical protein [Clostridiales bacterium]